MEKFLNLADDASMSSSLEKLAFSMRELGEPVFCSQVFLEN